MAPIYALALISLHLVFAPFAQVTVRACKNHVYVFQKNSGFGPGHIPEYSVRIYNPDPKPVWNIHIACGDFSSAHLVNPKIFRRLRPGDCLANDGAPMPAFSLIAFTYTNFPPYELSVASVEC